MSSFWDDLWGDVSPEERAQAEAQVKAEYARAEQYVCAYGCCVNYYDPITDRIFAGFGPVGCPCDDTDDRAVSLATRTTDA